MSPVTLTVTLSLTTVSVLVMTNS